MREIGEMFNKIIQGDCIEEMRKLEANSVDAVVTDPPYGIGFMGKAWDTFKPGLAEEKGWIGGDHHNSRARSPSMHAGEYDLSPKAKNEYQVWCQQWAEECLRILKPGGYLLASNSTRMCHRMISGIEDAGFEIRDMIAWVYGSGFPKSLNIGKAVDKLQGNEREKLSTTIRTTHKEGTTYAWAGSNDTGICDNTKGTSEWEGWGTALKPALEPITVARKPLSEKTVAENVLKWGTGGIDIDGSRVGTEVMNNAPAGNKAGGNSLNMSATGMPQDSEGTTTTGRFPANLIHDGSQEVVELFPNTEKSNKRPPTKGDKSGNIYGKYTDAGYERGFSDNGGSASRFFYCAKSSKSERNMGCEGLEEKQSGHRSNFRCKLCGYQKASGSPCKCENPVWEEIPLQPQSNNHPTVKPLALMSYLVKLVSKEGALVLDPFAGSGSTLIACKNLKRNYIGIEKEPEYVKIAEARLSSVNNLL